MCRIRPWHSPFAISCSRANKVILVSGASSSDLTGKACSPNLVHWSYDTYALSNGTARAVVASGGKSWYTLTADYAFGHAMEAEVKSVVQKLGGTVVGGVRTPINSQDFSSFLLQAQASKAQVVGLINAGGDTINSIKQSVEFGIPQGGQRVVATVLYLSDVHSLGLKVAQGLQFTESFYWDLNDGTRPGRSASPRVTTIDIRPQCRRASMPRRCIT